MDKIGKVAVAALLSSVVNAASGPPDPNSLTFPTLIIGVDANKELVKMPMGGVGTWMYNNSQAEAEVAVALKMGARLVDTANMYGNQVGIASAIKKSGVPRDELFISTKVPGGLGKEGTIAAHEENLKQLGVDRVDLLLTHFPCAFPKDDKSPPGNCTKEARQATWRGLEDLYFAGKARAIGVSHYCQKHLEDVLEIKKVDIAVNQQEWHVGMGVDPEGVVSFCKKHGISYQSFSPLCGPCSNASTAELRTGALVTSIGKAHNMTGSQVSLRWLVQRGTPVIAKSSKEAHLRENLNIFQPGFELTKEEMAKLDAATSPASAEPVSGDCNFTLATTITI